MQFLSPKLAMLLLWFLFLHSCLIFTTSTDLTTDRAALLALRSAVGGRTFLWNASNASPCSWGGVQCENGRVVVLRLPASSLAGALPSNTICNLTLLRTLSLRLNRLSGPLPADLSQCPQLRNLYLQGNQFSGPISTPILGLHSLVRLNLADNRFSGGIPSGFNNLTRLRTLYLESNNLSGQIPDLSLPYLVQFNVSYNSLNGSVPTSLEGKPVSAFSGNSLCGKPLNLCLKNVTPPAFAVGGNGTGIFVGNNSRKHKLSGGAIAGIVVGSLAVFLLLLLVVFVLCRKRSGQKERSIDLAAIKQYHDGETPVEKPIVEGGENNGSFSTGYSVAAAAAAAMTANGKGETGGLGGNGAKKLVFFGNNSRVFDLEDLLRASAEVLGKGTFGTAYKAVLEFGSVVAVKRLRDVTISEKEFREKIEAVGAMDQENLVPLRAYYYSREEKLLVYDYMPMGSLSALLHG